MLKYLFLLNFFTLLATLVSGQDYIYTVTGEKIEAKMMHINPDNILYQNYKSEMGEEKVMLKKSVYEDGRHEAYNETESKKRKVKLDKKDSLTGKNLISFHAADLLINRFTLGYERIMHHGKIGLKVESGRGFLLSENSNSPFKWFTGLNFHYYPLGQHKVSYFMGPSFRMLRTRREVDHGAQGHNYRVRESKLYYALYLKNGFYF